MKKFIPIEKQSKKNQREYHKKQRTTFEDMGCPNPVTRVIPDKKNTYDRVRFKKPDFSNHTGDDYPN